MNASACFLLMLAACSARSLDRPKLTDSSVVDSGVIIDPSFVDSGFVDGSFACSWPAPGYDCEAGSFLLFAPNGKTNCVSDESDQCPGYVPQSNYLSQCNVGEYGLECGLASSELPPQGCRTFGLNNPGGAGFDACCPCN